MGDVLVSDSREDFERITRGARGAKGEQGEQGARGARGERGLSRVQGRAIVVLFAIGAALGAANLFWTAHEVNAATEAQHQEQAAQQRQGAMIEQRLCTSLDRLAALKPPAGNPATNPSRAFDDDQHAVLAQLGTDVGCRGK
jgi:hypothetical protein